MITEKQIDFLKENMKSLDYEHGGWIIAPSKKHMVDECFLFIGVGGTGGNVLARLKREMMNRFEESEIEEKTRFLYVDTDESDIKYMIEGCKKLKQSETLRLISNDFVKESINPVKLNWENVKEWVNDELYMSCNSSYDFSGHGVGEKRQVGRAHITYKDNYLEYVNRINKLISELTIGKEKDIIKINICFFSGMAGGTGGGMITDLAIIARDTVCGERNHNPLVREDYVNLYGYLFMPSACGKVSDHNSSAVGNRNAYAALKEIDYFSSIAERDEKVLLQYGYSKVIVDKNLFDFCSIIEGDTAVLCADPAAIAQNTTVQMLVNNLMSNTYHPVCGGFNLFVDRFMNKTACCLDKISMHPESSFPRNANYVYTIPGFSQCVVPTDLICSYIMAKIYNELYNRFKQGTSFPSYMPNKKIEMFERFITEAKLDKKYIDVNGANTNLIRENIDRAVGRWMEKYGPFLLINFSKEFVPYIRENYVAPNATRRREKYKHRSYVWSIAVDMMNGYNNGLFEIYAYVIERFKYILDINGEILTDTQMYEKHFGSRSFSWSPVNIAISRPDNPILAYIDVLFFVQAGFLQNTIEDFCSQLWSFKDKWGRLLDQKTMLQFDAAEDIRSFMQTHIGTIIKNSAQDFILKVYSGDPNTTATNSSPQTFQNAAKNIYDEFRNRLSPMAQTNSIYCNIELRRFMAVPREWKQLYNALVDYNRQQGEYFEIYNSDNDDRIVCMQFNIGVAAYMLNWTKYAEEVYERDNKRIGLHMHQSDIGIDWVGEPNLYVEGLWEAGDEYLVSRRREASIINEVNCMMDHARYELGIVWEHNGGCCFPYSTYIIKNIKSEDVSIHETAQEIYENIKQYETLISECKKYGMSAEVMNKLFDEGIVYIKDIAYRDMVMTMPDDKLSFEIRDKNQWHLAKQIVRRDTQMMHEIEKTVAVFDEVLDMIKEA